MSFTADAYAQVSVSLGEMSGSATGAASGSDPSTAASVGQGELVTSRWYDTLYFGGLSPGTPEDFRVTSTFVAYLVRTTFPGRRPATTLRS
ncbi:MAG TPA: hypothetical protein VKV15_21195 [Bryobacteraceae bacterium]|nr:hypothetical protein [Bryobacteraceae bacterium]